MDVKPGIKTSEFMVTVVAMSKLFLVIVISVMDTGVVTEHHDTLVVMRAVLASIASFGLAALPIGYQYQRRKQKQNA